MKRRRIVQAVLLLLPVALYFWAARVRSWRPVEWPVPGEMPVEAELSPDGRTLAVVDLLGTVRTFDFVSRSLLATLPESINVYGAREVLFSPRGDMLAARKGRDYVVALWDVKTGKHLKDCFALPSGEFLFAPDGESLLATARGRLLRFPFDTGKLQELRMPDSQAEVMAMAPNGTTIALASREKPGSLQLWDLADHSLLPLEHNVQVSHLRFSTDDKTLFTVCQGRPPFLQLWDVPSATCRRRLFVPSMVHMSMPRGAVAANAPGLTLDDQANAKVVLSSDGRLLASKMARNDEISILDIARGSDEELSYSDQDFPLAFTPDGDTLITSRDKVDSRPAPTEGEGDCKVALRLWRVR